MRKELSADDKKNSITDKEKQSTLIVEWSGANDLATVNEKPSIKEVDRAIAARIVNIEALIAQGYRNFVLFNLPDLALTPRYQAYSAKKQKNASDCSIYFNQEIIKAAKMLSNKYPECCIDIFDINKIMSDAYNNPEKYGLERSKLKIPYIKSPDFLMQENGTSPATGYLFWDDVHPSADVHVHIATRFYQKYNMVYNFMPPTEKILLADVCSSDSEEECCSCGYKNPRN